MKTKYLLALMLFNTLLFISAQSLSSDEITELINSNRFTELDADTLQSSYDYSLSPTHPLFISIKERNFPAVEYFMKSGAAQYISYGFYDEGESLLQYPVQKGDVEMIRFLFEKGYSVDAGKGWIFGNEKDLSLAIKSGNLEIVELVLENSSTIEFEWKVPYRHGGAYDGTFIRNMNLFILAIRSGNIEIFKKLYQLFPDKINALHYDYFHFDPRLEQPDYQGKPIVKVSFQTPLDAADNAGDMELIEFILAEAGNTYAHLMMKDGLQKVPYIMAKMQTTDDGKVPVQLEHHASSRTISELRNSQYVFIHDTFVYGGPFENKEYWYKIIESDKTKGWVHGKYFKILNPVGID